MKKYEYEFSFSNSTDFNNVASKGRVDDTIKIVSEDLKERLSGFCENFCRSLPKIENMPYELDEIGITLEFTAGKEIKIVNSVSTNVMGGINLVFKKKDN